MAQLINDHLRCSTAMQTPSTPGIDLSGSHNPNPDNNNDDADDDDEQNFYSAPPSRMYFKENLQSTNEILSFLIKATPRDPSPSLFSHSNNPEHHRIYNQAVLLNSLIRNMMNDSSVQNSSSNESCCSNDTQVNIRKALDST